MAELFQRGDVERVIRRGAATDPEYRKKVLADPKAVLTHHTGQPIEGKEVKVLEETEDLIYLTIPPALPQAGEELSDSDLERVAGGMGGGGGDEIECNISGGLNFGSKIEFNASLF